MAGKLFDRGDIVHCRSPHADGGDSRHYAVIVGDPVENTNRDGSRQKLFCCSLTSEALIAMQRREKAGLPFFGGLVLPS